MTGEARPRDSGFALLFVFLMAAAIAITLYMELPRVAFEARRAQEQLLIDRGEEYRRAIQLFFRKTKMYPPNLDALEDFNNFRFLRRRYKDPMTGEDEWRVIHVGPGGVLTDSLVQKPPGQQAQETKSQNTYIGELPSIGSTAGAPGSGTTGLPPRRASEGGAQVPLEMTGTAPSADAPEQAQQPGTQPEQVVVPFAPIPVPGQTVSPAQPGQPGQPGQQPIGIYPQLVPGQNPSAPSPQQFQPVMPVPGLPAPYTQPLGQQPGTAGTTASPPVVGAPIPFQLPMGQTQRQSPLPQTGSPVGTQAGQPQNPAVALIQRLLTTPHPQGIAAVQQQGPIQQGGTGIAGVASKLEADSIKVYNDRSKYNEWEFLYDPRMDRMFAGAQGAQGGQRPPGQQPQTGGVGIGPQQPILPPQQPGPGTTGPRRLQ